ncbi:peroxisomal N(1)-acetyl-spermine/spermidine oxidase-like [Panulirus ornatus]|uniref:peroxisomal N(1)-acetyl-spermine/spermidine oxidase-like n=1 Tax=Panulirus ornatus TaxID=150431 RepID=UPI003A85269B
MWKGSYGFGALYMHYECISGSASLSTSPSRKLRPKVEVTCKNGKKFFADHVICTLPLGVLKESGKTMFDPPLPDYKMDSVNRLCFGVVDKIYLEYERPFLSPGLSEVLCLWDPMDPNEPVNERWFKKIYFLQSNCLRKVHRILCLFLNDPFIPKPERCINPTWWSQPFTLGSYTAAGVGASQVDITNISQLLYMQPTCSKPAVLFTGEHCHPSFYSTVHGAYLTGHEASQVLYMPDTPPEVVLDVEGTANLSSWVEGIALT